MDAKELKCGRKARLLYNAVGYPYNPVNFTVKDQATSSEVFYRKIYVFTVCAPDSGFAGLRLF